MVHGGQRLGVLPIPLQNGDGLGERLPAVLLLLEIRRADLHLPQERGDERRAENDQQKVDGDLAEKVCIGFLSGDLVYGHISLLRRKGHCLIISELLLYTKSRRE